MADVLRWKTALEEIGDIRAGLSKRLAHEPGGVRGQEDGAWVKPTTAAVVVVWGEDHNVCYQQ